jgi:hypothetical protein
MRIQYPTKYRLTGVVELTYINYLTKANYDGTETEAETSSFQQYYKVGVEGYIYHPRLAVFNANITYRDTKYSPEYREGFGTKDIGYDVSVTFLPYRPVSLDVYARKIDYTVEWTGVPVDTTSNLYGLRLKTHLRNFPSLRLEYYHWDYELLRYSNVTEKNSIEKYILDLRGHSRFLKTKYSLYIDFTDYTRMGKSYDTLQVRIFSDTKLDKGTYFQNFLNYSEDNISTLLGLSSYLYFKPGTRFNHFYGYNFYNSEYRFKGLAAQGIEDKITQTTTHTLYGTWGYRLSLRLNSSLSLRYGSNEVDKGKWNFYGIGTTIGYTRPLAVFNVSSHYKFSLRDDEKRGGFNEHNVEINLLTRRFRIGTVYTTYAFLYLDEEDRYAEKIGEDFFFGESESLKRTSETISHTLSTGIRGRLPIRTIKRSYWNVEAEYYNSSTKGKRPTRVKTEFDYSELKTIEFEEKSEEFSLTADLSYPLRKGMQFNLMSGYSVGENNSKDRKSLYYEARFNYPYSRNLNILAWWREVWTEIHENPEIHERFFEVQTIYRYGKLVFHLEGRIRIMEDKSERTDRRIFLSAKRYI